MVMLTERPVMTVKQQHNNSSSIFLGSLIESDRGVALLLISTMLMHCQYTGAENKASKQAFGYTYRTEGIVCLILHRGLLL